MFTHWPKCVLLGFIIFSSFILGLKLGPFVIRWLMQRQYYDQIHKKFCEKLAALHKDKQSVPTSGGIFFCILFLIMFCIFLPITHPCTWLFILSVIGWGALGWCDDQIKKRGRSGHGLTAKKKFLLESLLAIGTVVGVMFLCKPSGLFPSLQIPFVGTYIMEKTFMNQACCFVLSVLAILSTVNAVNITDGLDGLATGSMIMASVGGLIMACVYPISALSWDVAMIFAMTIGICCSFLWYNCFPAQIFMGDTGSLLLGGVLSTCFVLLRAELYLLFVGGIFVIEAASVVLQVLSFRSRGKRIFLCAPLHHHYEYQGISEQKVVIRFWTICFILVTIGVCVFLWSI